MASLLTAFAAPDLDGLAQDADETAWMEFAEYCRMMDRDSFLADDLGGDEWEAAEAAGDDEPPF